MHVARMKNVRTASTASISVAESALCIATSQLPSVRRKILCARSMSAIWIALSSQCHRDGRRLTGAGR